MTGLMEEMCIRDSLHPICTEQAISLSSVLLLAVSFVIMRKYFRREDAPVYPLSVSYTHLDSCI